MYFMYLKHNLRYVLCRKVCYPEYILKTIVLYKYMLSANIAMKKCMI